MLSYALSFFRRECRRRAVRCGTRAPLPDNELYKSPTHSLNQNCIHQSGQSIGREIYFWHLLQVKATGLGFILQEIILLMAGACQRGKAGGLPVSGAREANAIGLCPTFSRLKRRTVYTILKTSRQSRKNPAIFKS
jgi:hypothetical protein